MDIKKIRDALELARKVYDNYGHNDNNAVELIESFAAERERKAREETARKCSEAAVKWIDDHYVAPGVMRGHPNELRAAIIEAAHE